MVGESVVAVYDNPESMEEAVEKLLEAGVPQEAISTVRRHEELPQTVGESTSPDRAAAARSVKKDVTVGATVGGVVGTLAGSVALLATGGGGVAVAGALAAAVGGATTGTLVGLLASYSVAEKEATGYERLLADGQILLFVHGESALVSRAQSVLEVGPPCLLHLHGESPA